METAGLEQELCVRRSRGIENRANDLKETWMVNRFVETMGFGDDLGLGLLFDGVP
jgi:hypothetical protein